MPSRRWQVLSRQTEELRRQFLPAAFHPLGTYSKARQVQSYTRAFLVLAHAEIESFLEDWAKDIARASEKLWLAKSIFSSPLVYLMWCHGERLDLPKAPSGSGTKDLPERFSEASLKLYPHYYKEIKDNHGIKEHNFLTLFLPLGLPLSALGATLLANLDSFGALRGVHAHHSAKAVVSVLDPETEFRRVTSLVEELKRLDEWLTKYRQRIR